MAKETESKCLFPNMRNLGGFANRDGTVSGNGFFYRSGMPKCLGNREYRFLEKQNIYTVMDFRAEEEKKKAGWYQCANEKIQYIALPFYDRSSVAQIMKLEDSGKLRWAEVYMEILKKGKQWIREVFLSFASSKPGIIFYCASGKDRTGVISALLLELAGAEDIWILADYAQSQYAFPYQTNSFYETSPLTMKQFLSGLREHYGGAKQYLLSAQIPEEVLRKIKQKFY